MVAEKYRKMKERAEEIAAKADKLLEDNTFGMRSHEIADAVGASPCQVAGALRNRERFVNVGREDRASWMLRSNYKKISNGGENID
jgi:hypothetical protein